MIYCDEINPSHRKYTCRDTTKTCYLSNQKAGKMPKPKYVWCRCNICNIILRLESQSLTILYIVFWFVFCFYYSGWWYSSSFWRPFCILSVCSFVYSCLCMLPRCTWRQSDVSVPTYYGGLSLPSSLLPYLPTLSLLHINHSPPWKLPWLTAYFKIIINEFAQGFWNLISLFWTALTMFD